MTQWLPSPDQLSLTSAEVHIWQADLNLPWSKIEQLQQILAPDEQQRADRFCCQRDRQHFIAGRGILRQILSNYIKVHPSQVEFTYSQKGKPSLFIGNWAAKLEPTELNLAFNLAFNLSHSQGKALYAIAVHRKIGIDLEYIRPLEVEKLAKRFFTPGEYHALTQLPPSQRTPAFFHIWTCKEAYLKATGEGIVGLDQVAVSVNPDRPAKITKIPENSEAISLWQIEKIAVNSDFMAAVAIQPPVAMPTMIKYWHWPSQTY